MNLTNYRARVSWTPKLFEFPWLAPDDSNYSSCSCIACGLVFKTARHRDLARHAGSEIHAQLVSPRVLKDFEEKAPSWMRGLLEARKIGRYHRKDLSAADAYGWSFALKGISESLRLNREEI